MTLWMFETRDDWVYQKHKIQGVLPTIRTAIATILLCIPSVTTSSEDARLPSHSLSIQTYQETDVSDENIDHIASYEVIFKDGIRKALDGLNDINQIPQWWKHIDYYRDIWNLEGKKLIPGSIKALKLPENFDISPKNIKKPVVSLIVSLGNRQFCITPLIGKISNIHMTPEAFVVETNIFVDITYSKEIKLPDLMFRLWMSPETKGEKAGFRGVTVTEI